MALGVPVVEEPSAIPSPSERPPTPSRFIGATQLTATTLDGGDDDDEEGQQDDDVSDSDVRRWDSNLRPLHCCPIAEGRPFESCARRQRINALRDDDHFSRMALHAEKGGHDVAWAYHHAEALAHDVSSHSALITLQC